MTTGPSPSPPQPLMLAQDGMNVLIAARAIAAGHGHTMLNSQHILLGILETPGSLGERVLESFPIKLDQLKTRLWAYIRLDAGKNQEPYGGEFFGFALTEDGAKAMAATVDEAQEQGLDAIDSRIMILGMLREPDTLGGEILRQFDIDAASFRQRMIRQPATQPVRKPTSPRSKPRFSRPARTPSRPSSRTGFRITEISPIFLLLVAAFAGLGYLLYAHIGDPNLTTFLFVLVGWVLAVSLHEFGHALVAYWAGDTSVVHQGYLTLNPLKYTHPLMSIVFPIFFLLLGAIPLPGGAVYINRAAIRKPWMQSAVSAAGPLATLLFGILLLLPFIFGLSEMSLRDHSAFWAALSLLAYFQFFAFVLNLIPWPGLDGFGILEPWLSPSLLQYAYMLGGMGIFLFFLLFAYTPFGGWVAESVQRMVMALSPEATFLVGLGYQQFFSFFGSFRFF